VLEQEAHVRGERAEESKKNSDLKQNAKKRIWN